MRQPFIIMFRWLRNWEPSAKLYRRKTSFFSKINYFCFDWKWPCIIESMNSLGRFQFFYFLSFPIRYGHLIQMLLLKPSSFSHVFYGLLFFKLLQISLLFRCFLPVFFIYRHIIRGIRFQYSKNHPKHFVHQHAHCKQMAFTFGPDVRIHLLYCRIIPDWA